ncbi:MAG: hypothetical protein K2Q23_09390 [Bryobacteraceae bacterium]|nr:hypothetical protein [Bryobacteraceae bacterium]
MAGCLLGPLAAPAQISVSADVAGPGSSFVLAMTYEAGAERASAIQLDLEFDGASLSVAPLTREAARGPRKGLFARSLDPNRLRLLFVGLNGEPIPNGRLAQLFVFPKPGAGAGTFPFRVTNVMGVDGWGRALDIAGMPGAVTIESGRTRLGLRAEGVLSAASWLDGAVSPGEILTLVGAEIGAREPAVPAQGASAQILGGTVVRFDGVPAPILFSSSQQINLVAPYALAGRGSTRIEITGPQGSINPVTVPVAPARPSLFTLQGAGAGPAAALNQDTSLNTAENPAERGTVVVLFGTGAGVTMPAGVDGQVAGSVLTRPVGGLEVTVGERTAEVLYAGSAPGFIAGLLQVNVRIPADVGSGAVPVRLRAGGAAGPTDATVWIR